MHFNYFLIMISIYLIFWASFSIKNLMLNVLFNKMCFLFLSEDIFLIPLFSLDKISSSSKEKNTICISTYVKTLARFFSRHFFKIFLQILYECNTLVQECLAFCVRMLILITNNSFSLVYVFFKKLFKMS